MSTSSEEPQCKACSKTPVSVDAVKFLVCSRCQSLTGGKRKTYYCSKSCQTLDWPLHKPTICGKPPLEASPRQSTATTTEPEDLSSLIDTSNLSPSLLFHLAALKTLGLSRLETPSPSSSSTNAFSTSMTTTTTNTKPLHPTPAYLFFPTNPLASSSSSSSTEIPIPIHLSEPSHKLFTVLFREAIKSQNRLSITLAYSLLVTTVDALRGSGGGGGEQRLVEQLSEEFPNVNVTDEIERDEEPTEEQLTRAIGGQENLPLLLEWQMEEAERLRNQLG